tara:strand:- start:844 stop:1767 length:924 start_codon:yes stop_codon:yes gene_type:complete
MAFLDNSGDIILDAVLTDTGRLRLAKGDGSFNITKFALGDDEINYTLYDKNHPSGSAYFDIEILQSPVLEAFTNNTSVLKSKLLSVSRTNLLYLPEIRNNPTDGIAENSSNGIVSVAVDQSTVDALKNNSGNLLAGIIDSAQLNRNTTDKRRLLFDQGIVSNALGAIGKVALDADLVETQYIVEIDNRLGYLADPTSGLQATPSFIDDDNIASYYLSLTTNINYFSIAPLQESAVINGPAGYRLSLLIGASTNLNSSTYLFTQLGSTSTLTPISTTINLYHIDTTIRITGATTGFRVDIPIRFLKQQ